MTVQAARVGELLIDVDSGEILSDEDPGLDELCRLLKDGKEQEKSWKAYNALLSSVVGRKLDELGVQRALTPYGSPMWRSRTTRSAPLDSTKLGDLIERHGLSPIDVEQLMECAAELDPKRLDQVRRDVLDDAEVNALAAADGLLAAIDELIQERTSTFVQLMPLRQAAPAIERVEIPEE